MRHSSLADLFLKQAERYRSKTALRVKAAGTYRDISWDEFRTHVQRAAFWLDQAGVVKGDRVAILSENRPEWAYADLAALSLGAVVVPVYITSSTKEVEHVLRHSGAIALFVSTAEHLERIKSVTESLATLNYVVVFDGPNAQGAKTISFRALGPRSGSEEAAFQGRFRALVAGGGLEDLATIIYTSGTTGPPKGVMLSHRNLLTNCYDASEALPIHEDDVSLSFLPLSHVFERMGGYYLSLLCGSVIAYAENMTTVAENMGETHPTLTCCVPRFFEKMHDQIQSTVAQSGPLHKRIFRWAIRVGKAVVGRRLGRERVSAHLAAQYWLASRLVFAKIARRLGGRLKFFVSGGAPLSKELAEFFYAAGILILEGYGLTETSPVISVNRPKEFRFGSVGLPLRSVEVKIAPDGEILVRGPSIMMGYYQDEAATRSALEGGWFHTGDLGAIDPKGYLAITGRKKDIIVTSGGKNVSPQNIENSILMDPLISQIVIVGDQRNYLTALVVANWEEVKRALVESGGGAVDPDPGSLVQNPAVHQQIRERILTRTQELASYEKIKYFTLFAHEWTQEQGEVTSTLKLKRRAISDRYRDVIDRMYQVSHGQTDEAGERIFYVL